jgi:hypothetical protein
MEVYNQEVANPSDSNPLFLSSPSRPRRRKLLPPAVPLLLRAAIAEQCFLRCLALETPRQPRGKAQTGNIPRGRVGALSWLAPRVEANKHLALDYY